MVAEACQSICWTTFTSAPGADGGDGPGVAVRHAEVAVVAPGRGPVPAAQPSPGALTGADVRAGTLLSSSEQMSGIRGWGGWTRSGNPDCLHEGPNHRADED